MARSFPTVADYLGEHMVGSVDVAGTTITIHGWGKTSANGIFVNRFGDNNGNRQFFMQTAGGKLGVGINSGGGNDLATGATTVTDNEWHPFGMLKNGTGAGALQAWVDGAVDASVTSNRSAQSLGGGDLNSVFDIGLRSTGGQSWGGSIADLAIWLVALTPNEMVALSKGISPLLVRPASLYHYWPLWGISSPEIDLVSAQVPMILNGSPPLAAHAPVGPTFPLAA